MPSDTPNPPWYVILPDGDIDDLAIPDRLLHHPGLQQRGVVPDSPLKIGCVYRTDPFKEPAYAVKILDRSTEEVAIYKRLLREPMAPNNHTLPSELATKGHPVLVMPLLGRSDDIHPGSWQSSALVDFIFQIIEGIDFLHGLHIVHMDMCWGNILGSAPYHAAIHGQVAANRVYIIDFGASQQFALGPGVQPAITLPETQIPPPHGLERFDPYSWDMYCAAQTIKFGIASKYGARNRPQIHWLIEGYIEWLAGDEKGCTGVCHCRPTARTALRVALLLRWAFDAPAGYEWVVDALSPLWSPRARAS